MKESSLSLKRVSESRSTRKAKVLVPDVIDASVDIPEDIFDEFVAFSRSQGDKDFIIPRGVDEPLLQVNTWIRLPKPFQDLIGAPGIPCGLITEVYGPPDSGKTTFCLEALKRTQEAGGIAMLVLTERKFDLARAAAVGVDVKKLYIKRPKTIEDVREYIHELATTVAKFKKINKRPVTIVWDSVAATPCAKELDEKRGDFAADQAAAITVLLRKTQAMICDHSIAFLMINQISTKMGVTFGKKTQSKGGFAPKFYSALRIEFSKAGRLRAKTDSKDSDFCAIKSVIEVEKNHLGTPFGTMTVSIDYKGFVFDREVERKPDESSGELSVKKKSGASEGDSEE